MNDEQFDKELSTLYQQRKSQVNAPEVDLAKPLRLKKYSLVKLLSIFAIGGFSSFGIMAIITHFAKGPEVENTTVLHQHEVNIVDKITSKKDDTVEIFLQTEPPKKPVPPKVKPIANKLLEPIKNISKASKVNNVIPNEVSVINIPLLSEPDLLIKPVFKVMPKVSQKALQTQSAGKVRLRYEINEQGNVKNIIIVNSEANKELQRLSKRALAKWKYAPSDYEYNQYEVIFDFNLNH